MAKPSERQKKVLLFALVATLGIVLAINWAGKRAADLYGPQALAQASDGRVWVLLNHELHVLDGQGAPVRRLPVRALGISPPVAALAPAADGAMMVGSRDTGLVHVVDAQGGLRATIDPAAGGRQRLFGAFHLLPLPGAQGLLISDTSNHRLLRLDGSGRVLQEFGSTDGKPGTLHFPNGLALDRQGVVLLVDTNHHAIRAFTPDLQMVVPQGFSQRADKGYIWPALIGVAPDNTLFVSIMMNGMVRGRVFKLDREGKHLAELALPDSADPSGLLVRAEDVLVSDQFGLAIHRYDHNGARLGSFGDASLQEAYREVEQRRTLYDRIISGGQVLLIAMLGVLVFFLRRERRAQEQLGAALAVQTAEQPRPGVARRFSYMFWLALRLSFVLLALNVIANLVLTSFTRAHALDLAAGALGFLLLAVAPSALGVWHFDRMLRAGKYGDMLTLAAQTLLRRLGGKLANLMRAGDPIERLALVGSVLGPVQLLVLTSRRFLVLKLRANLRGIARAREVPRAAILRASATEPHVSFLRRLLGVLRTSSLDVEIAGTRHVFPVLDPLAATELAKALSGTGLGTGTASLRDVAVDGAPTGRRDTLVLPLLLSAILPGLGQLRQQRLAMGIILFLCVASWVLQMMGPLIAIARKTAEVDPLLPVVAAAGYAFIWSVSLLDTWLAGRAERSEAS